MPVVVTHWLYPVNRSSGYILERPGGANVPVTPDTVWADVQREYPHSANWVLTSGFNLMQAGDVVWVYATRPYQYLCAMSRVIDVRWDSRAQSHFVELMWDLEVSRALHNSPIARADFGGQHIQSVQRANNATLDYLEKWLKQRKVVVRRPDDPEGPASEAETRAWAIRQVRQRQGQGRFRWDLLRHYNSRCAVTGEDCVEVVEAAHISAFAVSANHDVNNGLPLRSDLHTLFDLHLIGVGADGRLVVSLRVTSPAYRALAGVKLFVPKAKNARPLSSALAAHLVSLVQ